MQTTKPDRVPPPPPQLQRMPLPLECQVPPVYPPSVLKPQTSPEGNPVQLSPRKDVPPPPQRNNRAGGWEFFEQHSTMIVTKVMETQTNQVEWTETYAYLGDGGVTNHSHSQTGVCGRATNHRSQKTPGLCTAVADPDPPAVQ